METDFASRVDATTLAVADALAADLLVRAVAAQEVSALHGRLWQALGDQVGGKFVRPRLAVAAYLGLGGTDEAVIVPIASAVELLHTAMLVHDDLLDHDETRRGRPTVTGLARAALEARDQRGQHADDVVAATGVLAGDLALAAAFDWATRAPVPAAVAMTVIRHLTRAVDVTVAGELLDMVGVLGAADRAEPSRVCALKTAWYSCVLPLTAGATLAEAPGYLHARLERLGMALGVAFQLIDDDLGVFGDAQTTGKSVLSDLREGKRTALLREGYRRSDAAGRAVLDANVGRNDLTDSGAELVRDVLITSGARAAARAEAVASADRAAEEAAGLPAPLGGYLIDVVGTVINREV